MDDFYALPQIVLMGGESRKIPMNLKTEKPNSVPFDADGCSVNFSAVDYLHRDRAPVISKECSLRADSSGVMSIAEIEFVPADTVALDGTYVYQITIIGAGGRVEIPKYGIMLVGKNINPGLLSGVIN